MNLNGLKNFLLVSSGFFSIGLLYAGTAAITITPNYTPVIHLTAGSSTTIEYKVTSNLPNAIQLSMVNIPGVQQVIGGSYCNQTFTLSPQNKSCTILLQISGDNIPNSGINSSIRVCDTSNFCYETTGSNNLVAVKDTGVSGGNTSGKILIFSDMHYNSLADGSNGAYQNVTYPTGNESNPNNDPNKGMLDNFISQATAIANQGGPPDFVLVNGDLIAHGIVPGLCNHTCVRSTIEYPLTKIWNSSQGVLNNIPIYPAIGNNDSYTGDYQISSTNGFYSDIGGIFSKYAIPGDVVAQATFATNFNQNWANYTVDIPTTCSIPGVCQKLIVLNTVPYSNREEELECDGTLAGCSAFRGKTKDFVNAQIAPQTPIIVSMHIGYSQNFGAKTTETDNKLSSTSLFSKCSSSNPTCAGQIWAGHWHWFSTPPGVPTYTENNPTLNTYLAPSVTPRKGAIPGFLIVTYNRSSGKMTNITLYNVPNYASVLAGKSLTTPIPFTVTSYNIS